MLLETVHALTDVPAILNTSLNLAGEPVALTHQDALDIFQRSTLDAVVAENVLISRRDV